MPQTAVVTIRPSIWPLFLVPLVAGVYYIALRESFAFSLSSVVADASDISSDVLNGPRWGNHWIYRAFAELACVPFAVFVSAGIARHRAVAGGLIGGLTICIWYLGRNLVVVIAYFYMEPDEFHLIEPWYQHAIEVLVILIAPGAGIGIGEAVKEMVDDRPTGFLGMNRWHLLWLWIAVTAYGNFVISPFLHLQVDGLFSGGVGDFIRTIVFGLPLLAYAFPAFVGLNMLVHESSLSRTTENILGPLVIVVGWFVATAIMYVWGLLVTTIWQALFG